MSKLYGKWISKDTDNLTHSGDNLAVKFSDAEAADSNKVWSSEKIDTISGALNSTISALDYYTTGQVDTISGVLSSEIDSDITAHASSADHDGRYYTETELNNGQLDTRYYTESEVDTISGALSDEIDSDITTHASSADHDGRYYTETELNNGQLDTRYYTETEVNNLTWTESDIVDLDKYTQAEVDTISGALNDKISAVGGIDEVEYITISADNITNKYTDLAHTPYSAEDVALDIIGGGPQIYTTDFTVVSGTKLNWSSLGLDGVIEAGDKTRVSYTYNA